MCNDDIKTTATIKQVFINLKDCLLEAKKPLAAIVISKLCRLIRKGKDNGEEDPAPLNNQSL